MIENLKKYSKKLSIKLRDPVTDGDTDGKVFYKEFRYNYLSRGLGRLIRDLMLIGIDIVDIYPQYYSIINQYADATTFATTKPETEYELSLNEKVLNLSSFAGSPVFEIYKAIGKQKGTGKTPLRGSKIEVSNAFDAMHGMPNEHYDPTKLEDQFYYTIENGQIRFIANASSKVISLHFLIQNDIPDFSASSTEDLFIPRKYEDLYLTSSALEASIDIGNVQKVNLYRSEYNTGLKIISTGIMLRSQRETTDSK